MDATQRRYCDIMKESGNTDQMRFSLSDRVALVTGASSGIGLQLAEVFARAGAAVALAARRQDLIESAATELRLNGHCALSLVVDVQRIETVDAALDAIESKLGRPPDVLLNCAGVIVTKPFLEHSERDFDLIAQTNFRGAFFVAQRTAVRMVKLHRGAIINVASTAGLRPGGHLSAYGASKAALIHLTKIMALELARENIRVNALCPGNIETTMHRDFVERGLSDTILKRIPQRRFGKTDDLSGAALLLASDAGRYITGSVLVVDGGQLVSSI
jgi:NAD(P)-dependent dehydrogenase (short-subunit alcohol dehydrogenase family)